MSGTTIPVRLSHILAHSGVGAVVHGADVYTVVQDTRSWTDRNGKPAGEPILYVERVRAALCIEQELRSPPTAKEDKNGKNLRRIQGSCIPASLFPTWWRCCNCGALARIFVRDMPEGRPPRCAHCNGEIKQVTWALAHPAGYLAEVPWKYLAHRNAMHPTQKQCEASGALFLEQAPSGEHILRCKVCGAHNEFRGNEKGNFGRRPKQPWTGNDPADIDDTEAQVLAINDTRLYSPRADFALVIPPESRLRKGSVVDRLYRNSTIRRKIGAAKTHLKRQKTINALATDYRCSVQEIEEALFELENGYPLYGKKFTSGQLLESEFDAFLEILPDQRDDEDLVTRNHSAAWHIFLQGAGLPDEIHVAATAVQHLVRVDRLKAIRVFQGFTRMGGDAIIPPDIEGKSDWLPAIELYGEGIFLALDENRLAQWEARTAVQERMDTLNPRYERLGRTSQNMPNPLTARFVLLHTLAHLLMRQIEAEGGYPAASLLERIYCSRAQKRMAGILIHVAVPDIAGSLGGLAELAEPQRFLGIFARALDHARWCPHDPVCREHGGQGSNQLNRAACHACALVPEPACAHGNALLDRCFVNGGSAGIFESEAATTP